jgi:hypothetical protein
MLGVRFRVFPSFFLLSALLSGILVYLSVGNNIPVLVIATAVDVACIFVALVFTELVQGLVYRSYGLGSTAVLSDLGGGIYPDVEPPTALQRIVVALAAPASSFLLFALVHYSNEEYHWARTNQVIGLAYTILWIISLFWGIIGFLPILPYPGGRILLEVLSAVTPRHGLALTLVVSILLGLAYIGYTVAVRYLHQMRPIQLPGGVFLPANELLAIFIALATIRNWQLLQHVRFARHGYREPIDEYEDEHTWWER